MQTRTGSIVAADGAIYAIRRDLFRMPEMTSVTDDSAISTAIVLQNRRLVFEPEALAYEPGTGTAEREFRRKVRLMNRGMRGVLLRRSLLNPFRHGFYAVILFSHKVVRRLAPIFLLALLASLDAAGRLVPVRPRDRVTIGDFTLEFLRVAHSMPDCVAVAVHTPVGVVVHTGDFKVDQTPLDAEHFDFHRFAELGSGGVLALFPDSTNIERPGFTGSEIDVIPAFEEIFASTRGKIVVTSFATSVYRLQILVNLAAQFGRKVAFVGRGMVESSQLAQRLGYPTIPSGLVVRESDIKSHPPSPKRAEQDDEENSEKQPVPDTLKFHRSGLIQSYVKFRVAPSLGQYLEEGIVRA